MGSLPSSLADLWTLGSQPLYSLDTALKLGSGWDGPYVELPVLGQADRLPLDAWGNPIDLDLVPGVSATTGQDYVARVISFGEDSVSGTGDDLTLEIYDTEVLATVSGYVMDASNNPLIGVPVEIKHPVIGLADGTSTTTASNGSFVLSDIPFGNRSLSVDPNLIYEPETAVTTSGSGDDIEFFVRNYSASTVTINRITLTFTTTAYYSRLRLDATQVFQDNNPRKASGDVVNFANFNVAGSGSAVATTKPVRIQSPFTLLPETQFGSGQAGDDIRIRVNNFRDSQFGGGSTVDMSGSSFIVTFSDGSTTLFTVDN